MRFQKSTYREMPTTKGRGARGVWHGEHWLPEKIYIDMVSSVFSVNWTVWLVKREALLQIHLNYHDGLFIFSDLFGIDLNFYYSALHVSASSPGHMLIITKLVLATFPFPLGESESCSKTKRCTRKRFHWLSIFLKMFLKTHPLRGYIPPPSPWTTLLQRPWVPPYWV